MNPTLINYPLLDQLRAFTPHRPLDSSEALAVAERQATKLLRAFHAERAGRPVATKELIESLPFLVVEYDRALGGSAVTERLPDGRWLIVINKNEPRTRQLFSLAHELKHVLDAEATGTLYPATRWFSGEARSERIADYFASCLIMAKRQIIRDWCSGRQRIDQLAKRYGVSTQAMQYRLHQLGLYEQQRCGYVRAA